RVLACVPLRDLLHLAYVGRDVDRELAVLLDARSSLLDAQRVTVTEQRGAADDVDVLVAEAEAGEVLARDLTAHADRRRPFEGGPHEALDGLGELGRICREWVVEAARTSCDPDADDDRGDAQLLDDLGEAAQVVE